MAEFFPNCGGVLNMGMWLYVVSSWRVMSGYSDVWHRGVIAGPFVWKGARCFFSEN